MVIVTARRSVVVAVEKSGLDRFSLAGPVRDRPSSGANAGTLPGEKVTRYELIVNLKAAHDIGITVPENVLKSADRVIH